MKAPLLFVASLLLIGCTEMGPLSDIPKPYQPKKGTYDTSQLVMADHIVVQTITGLDTAADTPLRKAVAKALGDHDILATTQAPPMITSTLAGVFASNPSPRVAWTLVDPYGVPGRTFETPLFPEAMAPGEDGDRARKESARIVAAHLVGRPTAPRPNLETALGGPSTSLNREVYGDLPPIFLLPILGAPGTGGTELASAIEVSLKKRGVVIERDHTQSDLQLQCFVTLAPMPGNVTRISLYWELKNSDGTSVAAIDQSNLIETGSLDGSWGQTAALITEAAADGIADFLRQNDL